MKTIKFAYKLVNVSRIGYLTTKWGSGIRSGENAVVMLVDGVELKEWYNTFSEAYERYVQLQKILEMTESK